MKQVTYSLIVYFFILAFHSHAHTQGDSVMVRAPRVLASKELKKGSFILTLNASASASNGIYDQNRLWSLTPQVGYLVANRFVVGLQFSMGKNQQRLKSGPPTTFVLPEYQFYSALPEIYSRYYLLRYKLKPFVQFSSGYNFQWGKNNVDGVQASVNSQNFALSGAFGLNLRISRYIGLEALYNARFNNNSKIMDSNELLKYRLGLSFSL